MKIYTDSDFKCHTSNDGTMQEVEVGFFDGKCSTFVEGYRFNPKSEMITPWKDYTELDAAQREYERQLLDVYAAALNELGVVV